MNPIAADAKGWLLWCLFALVLGFGWTVGSHIAAWLMSRKAKTT